MRHELHAEVSDGRTTSACDLEDKDGGFIEKSRSRGNRGTLTEEAIFRPVMPMIAVVEVH
jgi:hypothetical protein